MTLQRTVTRAFHLGNNHFVVIISCSTKLHHTLILLVFAKPLFRFLPISKAGRFYFLAWRYCRVARTHSRYWKLIKRLHHFCHFPYYRRSTSIQIQIQLSKLSNPSITHPNSLQTLNTHLFVLYISLLCLTIE